MNKKIHILILEDNNADAELIQRTLKNIHEKYDSKVAENKESFIRLLDNYKPDMILSDYSLGQFTGIDALEIVKKQCPETPFIIVTGSLDEETAVSCLKEGAWDYVLKEKLVKLHPAIENALRQKQDKERIQQAKEKIKESEGKYKFILNFSSDVVWIFNVTQNRFTYISPAIKQLRGLNVKEALNERLEDALTKDSLRETQKIIKEKAYLLKKNPTEQQAFKLQVQQPCKDGSIKWVSLSCKPRINNQKEIEVVGTSRDITKRKQAEEHLKENEQLLSNVFESMKEGILILDKNFKYVSWNKSMEQISGTLRQDIIGNIPWEKFSFLDTSKIKQAMLLAMVGTPTMNLELEYSLPSGKKGWTSESYFPLKNEKGKIEGVVGVIEDITGRKKAEGELRSSEHKYKFLTENINDIVWTADLNFNTTYVSPSIERVLGFTVEERMQQSMSEQITQETQVMCQKLLQKELHKDSEQDPERFIKIELDYYHKNGSIRCLETSLSFTRDENEKPNGIFGVSRDVTERKKAQRALKKSEEKFRKLIANSNDIFVVLNEKGEEIYVSDSVQKITGKSAEEYIGTLGFDHIHPEDQEKILQKFQKILQNPGMIVHAEYRHRHKNGSWIDLEALGINYLDDPAIQGIVLNIRDVTKRKSEDLLKQTIFKISHTVNTVENIAELFPKIQQILHNIIDTKNFFVALYDKDNDIISLPFMSDERDKFEQFPSSGKSLSSYVIKNCTPLLADKKRIIELQKKGIVDYMGTCSEIWLGVPLKIRNEVIGLVAVQSYDDPEHYTEKDLEILSFVSDEIALAIKHFESIEKLKREIKEKEVLLGEIHHRVKNNLQTLSGLLQLQQDSIETKEDAIRGFRASQDRILAMAQVYNSLLLSDYLSEVSVGDYIKKVSNQLLSTYILNKNITITYSLDELYLDTSRLGKIGLILNELVTNALKYAFHGRQKGNIKISLTNKKEHFDITITDNGIGIPKKIKIPEVDSLGLSLVEMLVTELSGNMSYETKRGTKFKLSFPK